MEYLSTRGQAPRQPFLDAMLAGLARDGGLYTPDVVPALDREAIAALAGVAYPQAAARLMAPFLGGAWSEPELSAMTEDAYNGFRHAAHAPLTQLDDNLYLLELFHGPTLAFKDFAMQFLGRAMNRALVERDGRGVILGATSGDTGAAAIEAFGGGERTDVFILFPHGRVSEVQRRQMTTVDRPGVHAIAIDGSFDDCQDHRQGAVQRPRVPGRDVAVGRQLHQLGAHPGADRLLLHRRRRPGRAASRGLLRRADRQFRRHAGRLVRQAHGPADRAA